MANKKDTGLKYVSLDLVLGLLDDDLNQLPKGDFETRRLGVVPVRAITAEEMKEIRNDSAIRDGKGNIVDMDEDLLAANMWLRALDKQRTDFDFGSPALLEKLQVKTQVQVVRKLLLAGEIQMGALYIRELSGFSATGKDIKN